MRTVLGIVAILIAGSLYGSLNSVVKLAYAAGFTFSQITYTQYIYAALGLAILIVVTHSYRKIPMKAFFHISLIGLIGLGGTSLFLYASLSQVTPSIALVLLFQFTWISLVIERIIFRKKIVLNQIFSVIVILVGTFCVLEVTDIRSMHLSLIGFALGLGAALCYSIFLIGSSVLPNDAPAFYQSFIMVAINVVVLFFVFVPFQPSISTLNPFSGIWVWGVILGVLGQFLPPLLFTFGAPIVGGTMTSILGSIELPVGVLISSLLLGQSLHVIQWLGVLLILFGIIISQIKVKRKVSRV